MKFTLAVCAVSLLVGVVAVLAQAPAAVAARVSIDSAVTDVASGTLTIAGAHFGTRPFVTLDLVPLNIQLAIDQRIIAVVPVGMMPPGSYLLTVANGPQASDAASTDVRIGPPAAVAAAAPPPAASANAADASPLPSPSDAAARVGDRTIALADVDREWQRTDPAGYLAASRQLFDGRRKVLADMVNAELLSREAASRGLTVDALLAEELPKRTIPLPDNSLTTLYQSLGDRSRGASLDQMRPALRAWLARKVEPDLAKMSYLEELTKVSTRADTLLLPPRVTVLHAADDPTVGPATAPVDLVVFGDFESAAYAQYALVIPRITDTFGNRVRVVFKHLPLTSPASVAASEAAACANRQGKFWPFHDALLGQAGALDATRFKKVASDIGVNRQVFDACVDAGETRDRIGAALDEARRYDIGGSPAFLVNGRLAPDPPSFLPPFEFFKRLIEEELQRQARAAAAPR
jgi:protein-disulfide isomerase